MNQSNGLKSIQNQKTLMEYKLIKLKMQHHRQEYREDIFAQFQLSSFGKDKLTLIWQDGRLEKARVLIEGCVHRNQKRMYRGNKQFYDDLQLILDQFGVLAVSVMNQMKIGVTGSKILVQCLDCARYTNVWKYCNGCDHVHYCSEGCQVRSKLRHQGNCKGKVLPNIDKALQVEVHVGSDLGQEVEVYYQHEGRMGLKMRGSKLMKQMLSAFTGTWSSRLGEGGKLYSRAESITNLGQKKQFQSFEQLVALYSRHAFVSQLQLWLLRNGGILRGMIRQCHNNHLRVIFVFNL